MLNPLFKPRSTQSENLGESLFEESSSFFAWYEWMRRVSDPVEGIRDLLTIMLISQYQTLTSEEEKEAIKRLQKLREDLDGGGKTFDMIPREINRILESLTESNSRSRLIRYAMKVEITMRGTNTTPSDELVILMEEMMTRVRSYMPTIQAEAICHRLEKFLETSLSDKDIEDLKNHLWTLIK